MLVQKFQVLFEMGQKVTYFAKKLAFFTDFGPNKRKLDIPLFVNFLNFDVNKRKIPLFGLTTVIVPQKKSDKFIPHI